MEVRAQNLQEAQSHLDMLCTPQMAGRGYVAQGDSVAAEYIRSEFKAIGLRPLSANYYHRFSLDVNTIPICELSIDGEELRPGIDYVLSPASPSIKLRGPLYSIDEEMMLSKKGRRQIFKKVKKGFIPLLPILDPKNAELMKAYKELRSCVKTDLWVLKKSNLVWSVAREQAEQAELWLGPEAGEIHQGEIALEAEANFIKDYPSQNVGAFVQGTTNPDSFIVLCGHYDHLGKMGEAVYSGANDNASGIAMMLDMARYFAANPQPYSIAFIGFAGEEAGLVGSFKFVQSPPASIPLERIKFVFNMDLMGNGEEGATIVNATVFPSYFERLDRINNQENYLTKLKKRGKAANSDHYFFSEAGVPSFFMYTMGDYTHYHIPQDNCTALHFGPAYDKCFLLIRDFILDLNKLN